jgi:hypothetical protein
MVAGFFADLIGQVVTWLIEATAEMIGMVLGWILDSPHAALDATAVGSMIGQGLVVGRYLLPLMLLLGVIQAGLANRPGMVVRLVFVDMPVLAGLMLVVAPATGILLAASDALTAWIIDESAITVMQSAFADLPTAAFLAGSTQLQPLIALMVLVALVGAVLVWGMMLMRNLGVVLSVVLGPGMLAARLWPAAQSWTARWATLMVALILVKPVIGFTLSLGWVMLAAGINPAEGFVDVQALAMGLMAFFAAALVPSFMFRFVPQVGDAVAGRLSSGLGGTVLTTVGVATSVAFAARGMMAVGGRFGGAGGADRGIPLSPAGQDPPGGG